jgi:hypothetical protein
MTYELDILLYVSAGAHVVRLQQEAHLQKPHQQKLIILMKKSNKYFHPCSLEEE